MKQLLLLVLLMVATPSWAGSDKEFVMTEVHCTVLKRHLLIAVSGKSIGVRYTTYVRDRAQEYWGLKDEAREVYLDILPYSLDAAYEYFHNDFNPVTPYDEILFTRCMDSVGKLAR